MRTAPSLNSLSYFFLFSATVAPHSWSLYEHGGTSEGAVLGKLVPAQRLVVLNERHLARLESKHGRLLRYTVGHEIGHRILHCQTARLRQMPLFDRERIWCRDGATDSLERQAEMFSAALLIGREQLRDALPDRPWQGWAALYTLADRFLVNATPMKIRLQRLGWTHCDERGMPRSGPAASPGQESLFAR